MIAPDEEEPIGIDEETGDPMLNLVLSTSTATAISGLSSSAGTFGANYMSMSVVETEELYSLLIANTNNRRIYFVDLNSDTAQAVLVAGFSNITALTTLYDDNYDVNLIPLDTTGIGAMLMAEAAAAEKLPAMTQAAPAPAGTLNGSRGTGDGEVNGVSEPAVVFRDETYSDAQTVELPALGHDYDAESAIWTWDEENYSSASVTVTCSRCGDVMTLEAEITSLISEPDCLNPGTSAYIATASYEDQIFSDSRFFETEALGHDWDEGAETAAPGCTNAGLILYTCRRCGETHFGTGKSLSRAETATFLWTVSGKPEINEADFENPFSDIKPGKWYAKYVLWAYSEGLVSGYEDGTFRPNNELNRGEILTLLYAWADKPSIEGIENPFSDVAPGKWYEAPALWAYDKGIECGEDGLFARSTVVLRETFVLYLYRCMEGKCLDE